MIFAAIISLAANALMLGMLLFELATTGRVSTDARLAPDYYGTWHIAVILLVTGCGLLTAIALLLRGAM